MNNLHFDPNRDLAMKEMLRDYLTAIAPEGTRYCPRCYEFHQVETVGGLNFGFVACPAIPKDEVRLVGRDGKIVGVIQNVQL